MIFRYSLNGQKAVVPLESRNASGYLWLLIIPLRQRRVLRSIRSLRKQ